MDLRLFLAVVPLCVGLVACAASTTGTAAPAPAAPAEAAAPADDGSAGSGDCPLAAADISSATSLTWELRQTEAGRPLETLETVKADVCVFTASDRPQAGGDPLVLRVDTVTGADAVKLRTNFEDNCTGYKGTVEDSTAADGAVVCRRDGSVVEGNIAGDGRSVDVYLVNADTDTATSLTPSFEKILSAVG
jgi:hypothetical protein